MAKHIRTLQIALVLILAFATVPRMRASADGDGDGIDDGVEQALAQQFLPSIYYSYSETCSSPSPQPVVFRARHPTWLGNPENNFILIDYVLLYNEDCGPNGHSGDNESFQVWLQWNGSQWQFYSISAVAHWAAPVCELATQSWVNAVWVGNDKHGTYADPGVCGCFGSDACSNPGWTKSHVLYNAGEPGAHLLDWLGTADSGWSSEYVWSDSQFFGAGTIRDQLYNSRYARDYFPPPNETQACYDQCWANYISCSSDPQQCDLDYNTCNNNCYAYRYYWDQ
jgi:hypothetical protein